MEIVILTSDSLRHKYLCNVLAQNFSLKKIIVQSKINYYNQRTPYIQEHFNKINQYEKQFFTSNFPIEAIYTKEINDKNLIQDISKNSIVVLFGTSIVNDIWLRNFRVINLHLGLSPYYRGSATLFWPFYNDEIECVGATIHYAVKKVDAGDILARVKPNIEIGDNYYTITNKTIKMAILKMVDVINNLDNITSIKQNLNFSKVYKKSDFNENVLKKVLDNYSYIDENILTKIKSSKKCSC